LRKYRWLTVLGLSVFCLVIILPPIIHGYVYPNLGDDTAVYLERIEDLREGVSVQYTGYAIVGYPMLFFEDTLGWDIDTQFLWFNFIALALSGIVLYLVFSKLAGRLVGWLSLLLVMFCAQGIFFLFYYGQIFNLINIAIFLPLLLYFVARYVKNGKMRFLGLAIVFGLLFGSFHTSGIYLPVVAAVATVIYLIYGLVFKRKLKRRALWLGVGITVISCIVFGVLVLAPSLVVMEEFVESPLQSIISNIGNGIAIPLTSWLMSILSPSLMILMALSVVYHNEIWELLENKTIKIVVAFLIVMVLLLMVATFAKLSLDPWRQALDLSTLLAVLTAVCVGLLLKQKNKILIAIVILAIGFGFYHNLPTWFSYNSAMRDVDFEAIRYLDAGETFSCSSQVAPWVYMRYTDAQHQDNDGDVVIMRSEPMTPRSTEDNIWYQKHGWIPSNEYALVAKFDDGEVKIQVYELTQWAREERARLANQNEE